MPTWRRGWCCWSSAHPSSLKWNGYLCLLLPLLGPLLLGQLWIFHVSNKRQRPVDVAIGNFTSWPTAIFSKRGKDPRGIDLDPQPSRSEEALSAEAGRDGEKGQEIVAASDGHRDASEIGQVINVRDEDDTHAPPLQPIDSLEWRRITSADHTHATTFATEPKARKTTTGNGALRATDSKTIIIGEEGFSITDQSPPVPRQSETEDLLSRDRTPKLLTAAEQLADVSVLPRQQTTGQGADNNKDDLGGSEQVPRVQPFVQRDPPRVLRRPILFPHNGGLAGNNFLVRQPHLYRPRGRARERFADVGARSISSDSVTVSRRGGNGSTSSSADLSRSIHDTMYTLLQTVKQEMDVRQGRTPADPRFGRAWSSCAVVGNSGSLIGSKHGSQIDRHEMVTRLNNAPTFGFEQDVGTRTTLSFVNGHKLHTCALHPLCPCFVYGREAGLAAYPCQESHWEDFFRCRQLNPQSFMVMMDDAFQQLCNMVVVEFARKRLASRGETLTMWMRRRRTPLHFSSGMMAVLLALAVCQNVDLYGFQGDSNQHHYFENQTQKEIADHDYEAEMNFYKKLEAGKAEEIPILGVRPNHFRIPFVSVVS